MVTANKTHAAGGFTLIELLVVIAIIGVCAAIAVPRNRGSDRRWSDCRNHLRMLSGEIELRRLDAGGGTIEVDEALIDSVFAGKPVTRRERHAFYEGDQLAYFRIPGTDEIACIRHGMRSFEGHRSARAQLAEAGVTDPRVLARVSDEPVSPITQRLRLEKIALWAFGGAVLLFVLAEIGCAIARFEAGPDAPTDQQRVVLALAMLLIGAGAGGMAAIKLIPRDHPAQTLTFRPDPPTVKPASAPAAAAASPEPAASPAAASPEPELPRSSRTRTAAGKQKLIRVLVMAGLVGTEVDDEILRSLADDDLDVTAAAAFALVKLRERTGEAAWKRHERTLDRALRRQARLSGERRKAGIPADRDPWAGLAALGDLDKQKSTEMLNRFADEEAKQGKSGFVFRAMGRVLGAGTFDALAQGMALQLAGMTSATVRAVVGELAAGAPGPLTDAARTAATEFSNFPESSK